ncbi:hypothetical protein Acel_1599 [Acidothermus cellulolyticus 11B]|uniref:TLP18.3, Psb32 and MOLO-1 founding protein of phosphatase n=1 Tax=Acidothermus cellulolyticus (strain ATCC 43068 / DSM 8971 / 11B) TaxID=351607 RepID=A0LVB1_ACIC1|nr:DUF5130 family protein [Acidothermus cellulolyticus]ABK53371.1 hypothetical protein Acel_1599 [Acidothermus cellulolyticus 11B]
MPGGESGGIVALSARGGVASPPRSGPLTPREADVIRQALAAAREETGLWFSAFIGPLGGDVRREARRLHAALGERAEHAVLVVIEPEARAVEIVTGRAARRRLDDQAAALAAVSMATMLGGGDLVGALVQGLRMLAEAAARPPVPGQAQR